MGVSERSVSKNIMKNTEDTDPRPFLSVSRPFKRHLNPCNIGGVTWTSCDWCLTTKPTIVDPKQVLSAGYPVANQNKSAEWIVDWPGLPGTMHDFYILHLCDIRCTCTCLAVLPDWSPRVWLSNTYSTAYVLTQEYILNLRRKVVKTKQPPAENRLDTDVLCATPTDRQLI